MAKAKPNKRSRVNQKSTTSARVKEWFQPKSVKVGLGILSLLIAVLGWYLSTCIAERKEAFREFKSTTTAYYLSLERRIQAQMAFDSAQKHFTNYLDQDSVQIETIKSLYNDIASSAKDILDACNAHNEAAHVQRNALPSFIEHYQLDVDLHEIVLNCEKPTRFALNVNPNAVTEHLERLVRDKTFREETVRRERINIENNTKFTANIRQLADHAEGQRKIVVEGSEILQSSLTSGVSDCLCSLITNPKN